MWKISLSEALSVRIYVCVPSRVCPPEDDKNEIKLPLLLSSNWQFPTLVILLITSYLSLLLTKHSLARAKCFYSWERQHL